MSELFRGYCFYDNGTYHTPTNFEDTKKALRFILNEKDKYKRVLVTDSSDCVVMEAIDHKLTFPDELAKLDGLALLKLTMAIENENSD
jgi:hypothetical protein